VRSANSSRFSLWAPVAAWMVVLFYVSSLSSIPAPPGDLSDKDEHFAAYAVLGAVTLRALAKGRWRFVTAAAAAGAVVIASAYGVTDEIHQRFVPGRSFDVLDMAADALGAGAAAVCLWGWGIIARRSDTRHVL
jgi:VanZ family protein